MTDDDTTTVETAAPERYSLPVHILDAVMERLAAQPYGEVAELIAAVQQTAEPVVP